MSAENLSGYRSAKPQSSLSFMEGAGAGFIDGDRIGLPEGPNFTAQGTLFGEVNFELQTPTPNPEKQHLARPGDVSYGKRIV